MAKLVLSLAINPALRSPRRMTETMSAEEAERRILGRALAALRDRAGLTQYEAAQQLGISTQAWQMYEGGKRRFTPEQIGKVTAALGNSPEDLMIQRARLLGQEPQLAMVHGVGEREGRALIIPIWGRAKVADAGPTVEAGETPDDLMDLRILRSASVGATRIADGSLIGWGDPGELVIFDRDRWPARGKGCVIEMKNGQLFVKLYEKSEDGHLYARQLNPESLVNFKMSEVKGVYAIRLRGD